MNLLLLPNEVRQHPVLIPDTDPRYLQTVKLLPAAGDCYLRAGIANGPRFLVRVQMSPAGLTIERAGPDHPSTPLLPLRVVVGATRPPAARRIVRTLTEMGVEDIGFYAAAKAPRSYLEASFWQPHSLETLLTEALAQSYHTLKPRVERFESLAHAIETSPGGSICYLDPYAPRAASELTTGGTPEVLLFGCDGGFSEEERALLTEKKAAGFHLGSRILRTDTAVTAAVSLWAFFSGHWNQAEGASFPEDR